MFVVCINAKEANFLYSLLVLKMGTKLRLLFAIPRNLDVFFSNHVNIQPYGDILDTFAQMKIMIHFSIFLTLLEAA